MADPVVVTLSTEQVREWCNRCNTTSCLIVAISLKATGAIIGLFVVCERCDPV